MGLDDLPTTASDAMLQRWIDEHGGAVRGFLVVSVRQAQLPVDLADDLLQEVFCRAWQARERYVEDGTPRAYLLRIADRLVRDARRRQRARPAPTEMRTATASPSPVEWAMQRENSEILHRALDELSEAQRRTLLLRFFGGLSFQEIANILECPLGTALSHGKRGLEQLRGLLEVAS